MNKIAIAYNNATEEKDKLELKKMFLAMYDHVTDQGVAYGSCLGNFTHYGYSFRGYYTSYFLMKDVLRDWMMQKKVCAGILLPTKYLSSQIYGGWIWTRSIPPPPDALPVF